MECCLVQKGNDLKTTDVMELMFVLLKPLSHLLKFFHELHSLSL